MAALALDTLELAQKYDLLSDKQYQHGKLLIADLAIQPGTQVLDVGCGTGRLAEYVTELSGEYGSVVGVDPLPLRIAIANARARPNLSFQVSAAENLSQFAAASFDVVYLNSVFHWLPDKATVLKEIARVVKPGGRIGLSAAAKERPHSFQTVVREVLRDQALEGYDVDGLEGAMFKVDVTETTALLDAAGFTVTAVKIRSFVDHFDTPEAVIDFSTASSFGNFLSRLPAASKAQAIDAIKVALESCYTPQGVELQRNLIFAVAMKN